MLRIPGAPDAQLPCSRHSPASAPRTIARGQNSFCELAFPPHANAQEVGHKHALDTKTRHCRVAGFARLEQIADENGLERAGYGVEILEYRQADEFRFRRALLHNADNFDATLRRAQRSDLSQIALADEQDFLHALSRRRLEQLGTVGLRLTEEAERIGQIVDGQPRLFRKALRREVVGISARRRSAYLDQAFFDAALQVGVDKAERDA